MQLTAADRTPEPGDVLRRTLTYTTWRVCESGDGFIRLQCNEEGAMPEPNVCASDYYGELEYVSRADGGPITKD